MKKVLSIVLSIAMVLCMMPAMAFAGTATASQAAAAYSDTVGTPCEGAVNVLHALGVVDGYTDGTYKPEQVVTRAEMAKLIVTALGLADYASATTSKFTDMGAASWAIPYVEYASNLNIVNGYGYGLFGPNDTVTYEQAVTMIVRALGYTDDCNEMNGSWPAIYVQKATALGLFDNVVNGGSAGADRGDVAIMLYNALEQYEVYADKDGATNYKTGDVTTVINGVTTSRATMMSTLIGKKGTTAYKVVTDGDVDNALINIREYLGAVGKVTYKDGDAIAVGDLKTSFISGDLTKEGKLDVDGTEYTIKEDSGANISTSGSITTSSKGALVVDLISNGQITADAVSVGAILEGGYYAANETTVKLAADVSGTTIKKIYSMAIWDPQQYTKVEDGDLATVAKNHKIYGVEFEENDNGDIDYDSFVLNGADSLDDIAEDNIVYVYQKGNTGKVARVDVGTEKVTGEVTKINSANTKVTINGKTYKKAAHSSVTPGTDFNAGDSITLYLDYDGNFFEYDMEDASSGDYALLVSAKSTEPTNNAVDSDVKVQLYTGNASDATVFAVNGSKYVKNKGTSFTDWSVVTKAAATTSSVVDKSTFRIVKYSVSDNKITKIQTTSTAIAQDPNHLTASGIIASTESGMKITKAGYLSIPSEGSYKLASSVLIWSVPTSPAGIWDFSDDDDIASVSRERVLDSTINAVQAIVNNKNEVVAMVIDDGAATSEQYGVVTATSKVSDNGSSEDGVDFYIGSEKYDSKLLETAGVKTMAATSDSGIVYKISQTSGGKYKFETPSASKLVNELTASGISKNTLGRSVSVAAISSDKVTFTGSNTALYLSSNVVIYTYDESANATTVGTYSDRMDIIGDDVESVTFYRCTDDNSDDEGLITYVVIWRR